MKFKTMATHLEAIETVDSRLAKTDHVRRLLETTSDENLETVLLFLQGRIIPAFQPGDLGLASKSVAKAIAKATGYSENEIVSQWKEKGDLGDVAASYADSKQQQTLFSTSYSLQDVYQTFMKILRAEGKGSGGEKIELLAKLITHSSATEAKYIARLAIGNLRIGIGEGTLRDGIAWAFLNEAEPKYVEETESINPEREGYERCVDAVQNVLDKTNDFILAATTAKKGIEALESTSFVYGRPAKVMLAQRAKTVEDIFDATGVPAAFEYKYDGMRMQIHIDDEVQVFTRRLEDVTQQFPEVQDYVESHITTEGLTIIDCEAIAYDPETREYLPFQRISQRIKRKYDIADVQKEVPVELKVFDILCYNGEDVTSNPYRDRRATLSNIITEKQYSVTTADQTICEAEEDVLQFFNEAKEKGNEGLMAKNLDSPYQPGNRVGHMLKYKATLDDLDLVIVQAEWGQGKRSGWLTSYTVACKDGDAYRTVGKVATGLKEKPEEGFSFKEMTDLLEPHIEEEDGREVHVTPKVVISVRFEEIQKSPAYSSGYALRFPRFVTLRPDRSVESISTLKEVETAFEQQ